MRKRNSILSKSYAPVKHLSNIVDAPGPVERGSEQSEPPELRCSVQLLGAEFVYLQKSIFCLQDIQERLFPRQFDLNSGLKSSKVV